MPGPRPLPLVVSLTVHGCVLGWVALIPAAQGEKEARSLYQQVIEPHKDKLVWYRFRDRLPEVSPLERRGISRPPRAEAAMAKQTIVSRPPDAPRARQMVWTPVPELKIAAEVRSPNLIILQAPAVAPQPPRKKLFAPPVERPAAPVPVPLVAAPPEVELAARVRDAPLAPSALPVRPQPRAFRAPEYRPRPAVPAPIVAAPPEVELSARVRDAPLAPSALPVRPQPRRFVAPPTRAAGAGTASGAAVIEAAPELSAAVPAGNLSVAIVGLNPADVEVPLPGGSRPGQFSAGPEARATGGSGEPVESARIFVPDLMIRSGSQEARPTLMARVAPTSIENLRAAARSVPPAPAPAPAAAGHSGAVRVSAAPDPSLAGRIVYSMTVQMPNVTSYFGSWIIWFAERGPHSAATAGLRPPQPLHKVDPKYVASAVDERVEGKVRLAAVIRKDGHVDSISLLHTLDERLDRSALEALGKWAFSPAARNGSAVEVDAVVEIPFRLPPKGGQ